MPSKCVTPNNVNYNRIESKTNLVLFKKENKIRGKNIRTYNFIEIFVHFVGLPRIQYVWKSKEKTLAELVV